MVVDTLHVVEQVVSPWEPIANYAPLAASIVAKMWAIAVAVHTVGFSFMAKEARSRRELLLRTALVLAAERLQVGVDKFAG